MTEKQYEEYKKKKEKLEPIKTFLFWCGDKYRNKCLRRYQAKLISRRVVIKIGRKGVGALDSTEIDLPEELQDRIIDVIEDYVEEKEKELSEI